VEKGAVREEEEKTLAATTASMSRRTSLLAATTASMSRRTSLDTLDFDANYGEMRHLEFSHDEEEERREQDILTGNI